MFYSKEESNGYLIEDNKEELEEESDRKFYNPLFRQLKLTERI